MNFSNTKKIRSIVCLICVLIMMCTLFTGCMKDDEAETTEDASLKLDLELDTPTEPSESETQTEPQPTETEPVINEKSATVISQLNIRSAPSTTGSSVIGTLYAGDKVIVERREEVVGIQWAYISSPQTGWICMDFVEMDIPDANNNNNSTPAGTEPTGGEDDNTTGETTNVKGVVTANGGLIIRDSASANGEVKGTYSKGEVVTILETKNGWGRTNRGWIKMQYVNTTGNATGSNQNNNDDKDDTVTGNGSTTVQLRGVVKVKDLNIRASASTEADRLGNYTYGERVEILEKSGSWGRTKKGWIHLDYVYQDCTTGTNTATGTITATELRIRQSPSTEADVLGSYKQGESVKILEQFTFGKTKWGCTNKGWISMDYVDTGDKDNDNTTTQTNTQTGTVTGTGLRIRSGAGTEYEVVGSLKKGDKVTVTEHKTVGGTVWGKISTGWICLDYVEFD